MLKFTSSKPTIIFVRKKKELLVTVRDAEVAKFIELVSGGTRKGKKITIDLSGIKDVEQVLDMMSIVSEVK